jgi:hypothetical protein
MSEGSWYPKTWREAVPLAVWGVLVFACGFEFIASATHGELWPSIYSGVGFVVLIAMLIHGNAFIERLRALDIGWMIGTALVLFALSVISQQQVQFAGPSADEIAAAVAKKMANQSSPAVGQNVATNPKDRWDPLSPAEASSLRDALGSLPKRTDLLVVCIAPNCQDLAESFMSTLYDAGWDPAGFSGNVYVTPVGIVIYQRDPKDRSLADAIEKATKGRLQVSVKLTELPTHESLVIGMKR